MLLTGEVVARLAANPFVMARSDWGVDTVITYATAAMGLPIYEHNVPTGKRHALYGSLADIRTMLVECLGAVKSLCRPAARPECPIPLLDARRPQTAALGCVPETARKPHCSTATSPLRRLARRRGVECLEAGPCASRSQS